MENSNGQLRMPYTSPYSSNVTHTSYPEEMPAYELKTLLNVRDVWNEWNTGIAGGPAVSHLEERWQSRWRPSAKARTAFCRRKVVWDAVYARMRRGLTEEQAVADLEAWRGKDTINRLSERLRDQEKRVLVRQEKRKRDGSGGTVFQEMGREREKAGS